MRLKVSRQNGFAVKNSSKRELDSAIR